MAAFIGFGIDNALVEIDCSELPILDGSSSNYIKAFKKIGLKYLKSPRKVIHVLKKITITENDRYIIKAFQRRFRPSLINGISDQECLIISKNLLKF